MTKNKNQIRDYFTTIADLLGLPASEFMSAVTSLGTILDKGKSEKWKEQENRIRQEGVQRRLIRDYYGPAKDKSTFQQYNILISGRRYSSSIYSTPKRVGLSLPLSAIETSYISTVLEAKSNKRLSKLVERQAIRVANKLDLLGVRFWDQDMYRLAGDPFGGDKPRLSFSISRYLKYRFTAGLLEDEIYDALLTSGDNINAILERRANTLPMRCELLPSTSSLSHLSERISAGGLACVVAMARGEPYNDYCIPLQRRSQSVAEGRGVYTASIQAWHQPITGDYPTEVNLYWTVLREMFEELYGGDDAITESPRLRHDWYMSECPGVAYIHKNPQNVSLEFVGIGMNALMGTYDCAILLAIHDPTYWETHSPAITRNWENEKWRLLSTNDAMPSLENIFKIGWLDQGMFSLSQNLLRLKELDNKRIRGLDIGFELT